MEARNPRLTRLAVLAILLALSPRLADLAQAGGEGQGEDRERRWALLVSRLDELHASSRQLEPLPSVIFRLTADPGGSVGYTVRGVDTLLPPIEKSHLNVGEDDAYRLVRGGWIVGAGRGGEMLVSLYGGVRKAEGAGGIILTDRITQRVQLPSPVSAYLADRWYVRATDSVYAIGDGEPVPLTNAFANLNPTAIVDRDRLVLIAAPRTRRRPEIRIGEFTGGAVREQTLRPPAGTEQPALILRPDGNHLLLCGRWLTMDQLSRPAPEEATIAACLAALESGDQTAARELLTTLTTHDLRALRGLAGNMRSRSDTTATELRSVQMWARRLEQDVENRIATLRRGADPEVTERVTELIGSIREEADAAASTLETILAEEHAFSPEMVARRIERGQQFFDGVWVRPPGRVISIDSERALVSVACERPGESTPFNLAIVDAGMNLSPMSTLDPGDEPTSLVPYMTAAPDGRGRIYVHVKRQGLGVVEKDTFTWLDRGGRLAHMDALLGCDRAGSLYFERRLPWTSERAHFIYRRDGKVDAVSASQSLPALVPTRSSAVVDDRDQLWFASSTLEDVEDDALTVRQVDFNVHAVRRPPVSGQRPDVTDLRGTPGSATLYRLDDDGTIHRYFSDPGLTNTTLIAGRDGALIIVGSERTLLVRGRDVFIAADLFAMATTHRETLEASAPRRTCPAVKVNDVTDRVASVTRAGNTLWVAQGSGIEAYRDGTALGIAERVRLRSGPFQRVRLIGPFEHDGATHMLLTVHASAATHLWLTAREDGEIDVVAIDDEETTALGRKPMLDTARQRVIFPGGETALAVRGPGESAEFPTGGEMRFLMPDGRPFVSRSDSGGTYYAVGGPDERTVIDAGWLQDLVPVAVDDDGRLICLAWNGVVWLAEDGDGDWAVTRRTVIGSAAHPSYFLGQTGSAMYIACYPDRIVRIPK